MQSVYNKGDTIDFDADNFIRNSITGAYSLADADSAYPKITITDAQTTPVVQVNAASMSKVATGEYGYSYALATTAAPGNWTVLIVTANGGYTNRKYLSFRVI